MSLIRRLQRIGGSLGIVVPKAVIELMNWHEGDDLELRSIGERLEIVKAPVETKGGSNGKKT